jgi:hypothetical protein
MQQFGSQELVGQRNSQRGRRLAIMRTVAAALRNRMIAMGSEARMPERSGRVLTRHDNETARQRDQLPYLATACALSDAGDAPDWGTRQVNEWLLLLLRFAVTSDAKDQSAALALADEIDARGLQWRPSAPTFFRRTTQDLCKAITTLDDPKRAAILKRHIARIDDPVLKRAFRAAVNIDEQTALSQRNARDLWFGLPR